MQGRQGAAPRRAGGTVGAPPAARPMNYNDLMLQGSSPPPPAPTQALRQAQASRPAPSSGDARHNQRINREQNVSPPPTNTVAEYPSSSYLPARSTDVRLSSSHRTSCATGSPVGLGSGGLALPSTSTGFLEGPLPPEVRLLIESSCRTQGQPASVQDEAERQARRLLSTNRRIKVYREELQAAMAESTDLEGVLERQQLVTSALNGEIDDIDAQIARLLQEKQFCEAQLAHERQTEDNQAVKLREAQERVSVLRNTVDNISTESHRGYLMLRQLVPNLNIDNYT